MGKEVNMSTLMVDLPVSRTFESSAHSQIAQLALAAEAGHEAQFLAAYHRIDWVTRSPGEIVYAVRLALLAGAHWAARELALNGAQQYHDHAELQKMAHILAPPKVQQGLGSPSPGLRANRDWLRDHREQYRGQWVALRNGQLLRSAATHEGLLRQIGSTKHTDILVAKVY
jgi:hypothetical protein